MSTTLAELEVLFWNTARGHLDTRAVQREFRGERGLSAVARLAIYRDMYFARQLEALLAEFPLLMAELGESALRELSRDYLLAYPSRRPAIEWLGEGFADFLRARGLVPLPADLAQLEWSACAALISPHDALAHPRDADADAWPWARLRLVRSLQTVQVGEAALGRFLSPAQRRSHSRWVAIWRQDFRVRSLELACDEVDALVRVRAGQPFCDVCSAFDEAARAHEVLQVWFARGWISRIEVEPS